MRQPSPFLKASNKTVYEIFLRRNIRQSNSIFSSAQKNEQSDQDRILTVPNLLCVGRIAVSPYLATSIINGDLKISFVIFGLAGFSDLVSIVFDLLLRFLFLVCLEEDNLRDSECQKYLCKKREKGRDYG